MIKGTKVYLPKTSENKLDAQQIASVQVRSLDPFRRSIDCEDILTRLDARQDQELEVAR